MLLEAASANSIWIRRRRDRRRPSDPTEAAVLGSGSGSHRTAIDTRSTLFEFVLGFCVTNPAHYQGVISRAVAGLRHTLAESEIVPARQRQARAGSSRGREGSVQPLRECEPT
jgi:hypothetical protein